MRRREKVNIFVVLPSCRVLLIKHTLIGPLTLIPRLRLKFKQVENKNLLASIGMLLELIPE